MQPTPPPFGAPVLFSIEVSGKDTGAIEAVKEMLIPFAIKVGDVFTFESLRTFAAMPAEAVSYDLTEQQYTVGLDTSKTDWDGCNTSELVTIREALIEQGWAIKYYQI